MLSQFSLKQDLYAPTFLYNLQKMDPISKPNVQRKEESGPVRIDGAVCLESFFVNFSFSPCP